MLILARMSQVQHTAPGVELTLKGTRFNMLAIIESWEQNGNCREDNTSQFLIILLLKVGLDCLVLSMFLRRLHNFMGVCRLSVVLIDVVLACTMAAVWMLGPARSQVSLCFLLAHASAMFNALPLPVLVLGLLDYAACHASPYRALWNCILTLLVWVLAGVHSYYSALTNMIEVEYERERKALGCVVQESLFVVFFSVGISIAICCVLLWHYKLLFSWLKEANELSDLKDNKSELQSALSYRFCNSRELGADEQTVLDIKGQRPPLYLILTLDFGTTWTTYLIMCTACELLGLAVPAYISINILWLECTNSFLVGLIFWLNRDWFGPYGNVSDEICQWNVFWHLSNRRVLDGERLPKAMFSLTGKDRNPVLHV